MSGTSSAVPQDLEVFVNSAGAATARLDSRIAAVGGTVMAFFDAPCDGRFRPAGSDAAFNQVRKLVSDNQADERWIGGIRHAFIAADTNTLPDSQIAAALRAAHINASAPGPLTTDEPVYQGTVMYSGWSDDPVSTATGHFLYVEHDLAMPEALGPLRWTRTYGSRFLVPGAMGPGWHTWADTRLEVTETQVVYHGPDGQVAPFARTSGGLVGHPAMEADLEEIDGGFALRWRWNARFPGMRWRFDTEGGLLELRDPVGGTTTATREDGRLIALTHEGGRHLEITWAGGAIVAVASSDGRRCGYAYSGGHLAEVDRPGGAVSYVTGGDGRIAEIFDADGVRLVANDYDSDGRVVAQTSPFGRVTTYGYARPHTLVVGGDDGVSTLFRHDDAGRLVEMQLSDGKRATRRFDERGNPVEVRGFDGSVTRREFDTDGNCVRQVDPAGGVTEHRYDELGRVVRTVDPSGVWTEYDYEGDCPLPSAVRQPLGGGWRFETAGNRVVSVVDADGVAVTFERDADGQVVAATDGEGATTRFRYGPDGALVERVSPLGVRWRAETDGAGRSVSVSGDAHGPVEFVRSAAGRVTARRDALGATLEARYGDHGELVALRDPSGAEATLAWDAQGNAVGMILPDGGAWAYDHDELGRMRAVTDPTGQVWGAGWSEGGFFAGFADPLGHAARSVFDAVGRQVEVTTVAGQHLRLEWDPAGRFLAGDCPEQDSSCRIVRDEAGRPVEAWIDGRRASRCTYTPAGRLATLSRPDGAFWSWTYDRAGRPVQVEGTDGVSRVGYDADGNVIETAEPSGAVVSQEWGSDGRLAARTVDGVRTTYRHDPAGRLVEERAGDAARRYAYDERGLLSECTDPLGAVSSFEYDACGRVTAVVGPDGGRWTTERDAAGRPTATVDPLGRRTETTLDAAGRVVAVTTPDGVRTDYSWSPAGDLESVNVAGTPVLRIRRSAAADEVVVTDAAGRAATVRFDARGRVVEVERAGAAEHWAYDDDSRAVDATGPAGARRVVLDGDGLPVALGAPGVAAVRVERDAAGRVAALEADGLERRWTRSRSGAVVAYEERIGAAPRRVEIGYDDQGRVVSVTGDGSHRYTYDAAGQLIGDEGPEGTWSWSYDEAGRLASESGPGGTRSFHYDGAGQLVRIDTGDGSRHLAYDERGRRVSETGAGSDVSYRWDERNRLVEVSRPGRPATTVAYDPLGLPERLGDEQVRWSGLESQPVLAGIGDRSVLGLPGLPLAAGPAGAERWVPAGWEGSVGVTSPWGDAAEGASPGPGYLGELQFDGLVWLRNRVYDPKTRSFLSRDPLAGEPGWPGGPVPGYGYALNNPLMWADPLGLKPVTADAAAAQMQGWRQGHMKELVVTVVAAAVIVGVGVLTCGVGDVALASFATPVLIGAGVSGGTTAVSSLLHGGHVDWSEVAMNTVVGGAFGAVAPGLPAPAALSARIGVGAAYGGVSAGGATALDEYGTGHGFHPLDDLESAGIGAATGGILHGAHWTEGLRPNQLRNFNRYLETSKANPDPNDPSTWSRQWQNRFNRLNPAAEAATARRGNIAGIVTPPGVGAAVPPPPDAAIPSTAWNLPHAAARACVRPVGLIGPVACP